MHEKAFSLENYLKAPLNVDFSFHIDSLKVIEALKKLLFRLYDFTPLRWKLIKKIRNLLISEKVVSDFSLNLIPSLSVKTYMKDSGGMYISLGALLFRSSMVTLKVFCHELSHIWLSTKSFYPVIKVVNKEFKIKFKHSKDVVLASPVEVYAMKLSIGIMEQISDSLTKNSQKKRWKKIIVDEYSKLNAMKDLIINL